MSALYFSALSSRFSSNCVSSTGSPLTRGRPAGTLGLDATRHVARADARASTAPTISSMDCQSRWQLAGVFQADQLQGVFCQGGQVLSLARQSTAGAGPARLAAASAAASPRMRPPP